MFLCLKNKVGVLIALNLQFSLGSFTVVMIVLSVP